MRYQLAQGRRTQLRLPLSPVKAQMALAALENWREAADDAQVKHWYRIRNAADGQPTQVNIFDEISWWGISAQQFVDELSQVEGPVEVHINSPGGDAYDGITIYNALRSRGDVTTVVDGMAASAASVIYMAGTTRVASPGSMVMIHDALALCIGNAAEMRDTAGMLDKVSDSIASLYALHTDTSAADWRKVMQAEGWYNAQESVDAGIAHKLAGLPASSGAASDAAFDRSVFAAWQEQRPAAAEENAGDAGTEDDPAGLPAWLNA